MSVGEGDAQRIRELAAAARVDARTVRRALDGHPIRSSATRLAIAEALRARGEGALAKKVEKGTP